MGSPTNHRPTVPQIIFDNIAEAKRKKVVECKKLTQSWSAFSERELFLFNRKSKEIDFK